MQSQLAGHSARYCCILTAHSALSPPPLSITSGPSIKAGEGLFPGPSTPVAGLYCCGDSRFPGIGLPAVAASGAITANSLVPVWDHIKLLEELAV